MVDQLGPVYLNGLTISAANDRLRGLFSRKYAGVSGEAPSSDIRVTLGQLRTIQVNILGEVATPGTYRLSSFATVFHALYKAGGITDIGTLRNIRVLRGGRRSPPLTFTNTFSTGIRKTTSVWKRAISCWFRRTIFWWRSRGASNARCATSWKPGSRLRSCCRMPGASRRCLRT